MLLALRLRDFVIVDRLELEFGPGFSVLSGETGAGKSILLGALALAMGARADTPCVRDGCARADITAEFRTDPELDEWLAARDLAGDPGVVHLRRVIEADGRSRALVNGQPATAAIAREVGKRLVDVHGQHAAQSLTRGDGQRELLDAFGALKAHVRETADAFARMRAADRALEEAERGSREIALERERLEWLAGELSKLALHEGEWEELGAEQRRLSHAASLIEGAGEACRMLCDGDDAASSRAHAALARLRPLAQYDGRLAQLVERLDAVAIELDDASSQLAAYADRVDLDPQRLREVDERISAAFAASRKFRVAPEALPRALADANERLRELEQVGDAQRLRELADQARERYRALAGRLSQLRAAAAGSLSSGVSELLGELGMAGARLVVSLEPGEPSASGSDRVEFRVATHPGTPARPLAKIASGGELSRIGLAIAVLAARENPTPTLVFDEADAGVGGAVAEVIGHLMRRLGEDRQVLCVTHLPQVAARAHGHYVVTRETRAGRALSDVRRVEDGERVEEIARMLGGVDITATTRLHAREMLAGEAALSDAARGTRSSP